MEYGKLLRRSWDILVAQKYLIILGVLAALGDFSGSGSSSTSNGGGNGESGGTGVDMTGPSFDMSGTPFESMEWFWLLPAFGIAALIGFAIIIGIVIWVVSNLAEGGLVAGANTADDGETMTFGQAWGAAWSKVWRLLGISLIPAIPMLIFLGIGIATFFTTVGVAALNFESISAMEDLGAIGAVAGTGFVGLFICLLCVLIAIWIVLEVIRIFALRACMLEDTGVFDAYRRGVAVIRENFGEFFALLLLRFVIGVALFLVLFVPGMVMACCCIFWPLLLVIRGAIAAYFSTMWTLAWREWTGMVAPPQLPDADGGGLVADA